MMHVVCTRFNVPFKGRVLDDAWLAAKLKLFLSVFVPGMRSQTVAPDAWLFAIARDTPAEVVRLLAMCGVTVCPWQGSMGASVAPFVTAPAISTQLGADDAFAPDAMARVRAWAEGKPVGSVMNFPDGFKVRGGQVYRTGWDRIAMHSLITDDPAFTVYELGSHTRIADSHDVDMLDGPAWAHTVHCNDSAIDGGWSSRINADELPADAPDWTLPARVATS